MVAYDFSQSTDGPFSNKLGIVANAFFTSIFMTNFMVTSLTAFKIWRCRKIALLAGASCDYTGAFNVVVESGKSTGTSVRDFNRVTGAIYSFILMMELLLYAIGQNFVFVLYTSMAQITVRFLPFCCDPTHISTRALHQPRLSSWSYSEGPCGRVNELLPPCLCSEARIRSSRVWDFPPAEITPRRSTSNQQTHNKSASISNKTLKL